MSDTAPQTRSAVLDCLYDQTVVFVAGLLMALGVAMVYSASVTIEGAGLGADWRTWWTSPLKQAVFAAVGFLVMLLAAHFDYRTLGWYAPGHGWRAGSLAVVTALLLAAVLVPGIGRETLGARRAIALLGTDLGFQPSELAKVVIVVWLAALLTRPSTPGPRPHERTTGRGTALLVKLGLRSARPAAPAGPAANLRSFPRGFVPAVASAGLLIALTGIEDFGTAALMGVVMLILLVVAGARWGHLALLAVAGIAAGVALVAVEPYRVERVHTFISSAPDPQREGYQINQALMAIGSGGWYGRGLGAGVQKYGYLPQDHNDFILAIICEELGVVGGMVVVLLFLVLLWRGWRIAAAAPDAFGRLLATGLTMAISLQAAMNIGVVTNSIPTKGISLPFVSAGGSGVVFLGLAAGLLASVGRRSAPAESEPRA